MLNKITLPIAHSQVNTKFGLFFFTLAVHSLIKLIRVTLHKYPVHTSYRKSKNDSNRFKHMIQTLQFL